MFPVLPKRAVLVTRAVRELSGRDKHLDHMSRLTGHLHTMRHLSAPDANTERTRERSEGGSARALRFGRLLRSSGSFVSASPKEKLCLGGDGQCHLGDASRETEFRDRTEEERRGRGITADPCVAGAWRRRRQRQISRER